MNNRTFSGYQMNKIWLNDGAGRFQEVAEVWAAPLISTAALLPMPICLETARWT
jgi:hypothetical protein